MSKKGTKRKTKKKATKPEPVDVVQVPDSGPERIPKGKWVQTVVEWLIQGQNVFNITEAIAELITTDPSETVKLWEDVFGHLKEAGDINEPALRGWCIEASKDVYRKLLEVGDYTGAARVVADIYKLFY